MEMFNLKLTMQGSILTSALDRQYNLFILPQQEAVT